MGRGQFFAVSSSLVMERAGSARVKLVGQKAGGANKQPNIFNSDFNFNKMGIGGLDSEFAQIFKRAFASRIFSGIYAPT